MEKHRNISHNENYKRLLLKKRRDEANFKSKYKKQENTESNYSDLRAGSEISGSLEENIYGGKKIYNLYGGPLNLSFDPKKLDGLVKLVIFPDYSPNKGLPTGSLAIFDENKHKINSEYVGPDIGCGMVLGKFLAPLVDMEHSTNGIASRIFDNYAKTTGSLGGGNHFVTLYKITSSENPNFKPGDEMVLVHSGSRQRGVELYERNLSGEKYLKEQDKTIKFGEDNRKALLDIVQEETGKPVEPISDKIHNYAEKENGLVFYRKGLIKVKPGELTVIPSSMGGNAVIVKAKENISELFNSLPHGTGRKISRSDSKKEMFFLNGFPEGLYFPYFLDVEDVNSELPQNYRDLDEVLPSIKNYISVEAVMKPISSVMR